MHSEALTERGTETSTFFLAKTLMNLGHDIVFSFNQTSRENNLLAVDLFEKNFEIHPYKDFRNEMNYFGKNFEIAYFVKNRDVDKKSIPRIWNANHVIFSEYLPHGNTYTYISKSCARLSKSIAAHRGSYFFKGSKAFRQGCRNALNFDFVPLMVDMPNPVDVNRSDLGIPEEAFVIVRLGGSMTFDIPWVRSTLVNFLDAHKNAYFLAINTDRFADHKRIKHIDTVVDLTAKASYLSASDLFLHARNGGETFGMSIVESLQMGVPVIAFNGGRDKEHINHLDRFRALYHDESSLWNLLMHHLGNSMKSKLAPSLIDYGNTYRPQVLLGQYNQKIFGGQIFS